MRIGIGHDTHRLLPGRPLILGGVRVEYERGLVGHIGRAEAIACQAAALIDRPT